MYDGNGNRYSKIIGSSTTGGTIGGLLVLMSSDGTSSYNYMYFSKSQHEWEYRSKIITAGKDFTKAYVFLMYYKQTGTGYFDDFKLSKTDNVQLLQQPSFELDSDTIEYTYDGNGNRYSKTITPSGGTPETRYYSYDTSGNIVSEYKRVMVNGSEKSQTLVRYIRDTGGKAISMINYEDRSSNNEARTFYFIYNGHGDVTALTDSSGTVVATYSYDEFGSQLTVDGRQMTDNGIYNPIRYGGAHNAYYDSETSLYKMGTRYYQPDVGRWLTRDPDKAKANKLNTNASNKYAYADNNPLTKIDSSGHSASTLGLKKIQVNASYLLYDVPSSVSISGQRILPIRVNYLAHRQRITINNGKVVANTGWRKIGHSKTGWITTYYPETKTWLENGGKKAAAFSEAMFVNPILLGGQWRNKFQIGTSVTNKGLFEASLTKDFFLTSPNWTNIWHVNVKVNGQRAYKKVTKVNRYSDANGFFATERQKQRIF